MNFWLGVKLWVAFGLLWGIGNYASVYWAREEDTQSGAGARFLFAWPPGLKARATRVGVFACGMALAVLVGVFAAAVTLGAWIAKTLTQDED